MGILRIMSSPSREYQELLHFSCFFLLSVCDPSRVIPNDFDKRTLLVSQPPERARSFRVCSRRKLYASRQREKVLRFLN